MNWDEIRAMLQDAHEEPLEEAHLAAVRARVLGRLHRKRRVWWPVWAGVGAAAGILAVMLFVARTQQPAIPNAVGRIAAVQAPTAGPLPDGRGSIPSHERKRVQRQRPVPPSPEPAEPLLVKLITDDPNVVIYWIADAKGD